MSRKSSEDCSEVICMKSAQLKEKEKLLFEATSRGQEKSVIEKLTVEINQLKRELTNLDTNIVETPKSEKNAKSCINSRFLDYREKEDELSDVTDDISEENADTVLATQNHNKVVLKPPKFGYKSPEVKFSTPIPEKIDEYKNNFHNQIEKVDEIDEEPRSVENAINTIKAQLSIEIKPEILDSFFEDENNFAEFENSHKQGIGIFDLLNDFRKKILLINPGSATIKKNESEIDPANNKVENNEDKKEIAPVKSDLGNYKTEDSTREQTTEYFDMNSTITQVRGLSLKDALELIPRFNGHNISLSHFLDGCQEAKSILPDSVEGELAKLVRIRLFGEALSSARGQDFSSIRDISEFFEKIFGSLKTYHEWNGELARAKQQQSESVITYLNRVREIEQEICKAARREDRMKDEATLIKEIERDAIKYFLRGLKWEIRARMSEAGNWREARENAIEIEREFAGSTIEEEPMRNRGVRETRKINYVEKDEKPDLIFCGHCKMLGHVASNCVSLVRQHLNNYGYRSGYNRARYDNNFQNYANARPPRNNNEQFNANFGGWNAENRQRREFLPGRIENTSNRSAYTPRGRENNVYNSRSNSNRYVGRPETSNSRAVNNFNPPLTGPPNIQGESNRPMCFYCGRPGHVKRDCYRYKRDVESGNFQGNGHLLSPSGAQRENQNTLTAPTKSEAGAIPKSRPSN